MSHSLRFPATTPPAPSPAHATTRVAIVTGHSQGLGQAIAADLLRQMLEALAAQARKALHSRH